MAPIIESKLNVAHWLVTRAAERPFQRALIQPHDWDILGHRKYSHLTFAQLGDLVDALAHGLKARGVTRGMRLLMLVDQGPQLIALTFALFKLGAVPVLIDPGMGRRAFLDCVRHAAPQGLIGIGRAHLAKLLFRKAFASVTHAFTTEKKWWIRADSLDDLTAHPYTPFPLADTAASELAAILFTSGSTGPAKGVHYTHDIFDAQVQAIGQMYGIEPGEIEVPAFPLFSLFSIALGMTCVIPDMDPTKPAEVNPAHIVEAILDHGATTAFGSPAVWKRVGPYCVKHGITLPTLKRIMTAGAPIHPDLHRTFQSILPPGAWLHTPYGATEHLPVSTISGQEVLADTEAKTLQGGGICVGHPIEGVEVRILEISDDPIVEMSQASELGPGQVGEICVRGRMTTPCYDTMPEQTAQAKIPAADGTVWHRMGDVGTFDQTGRLWYHGRKAHRVETSQATLFTIPCEAIANQIPGIARSALVGIGPRGTQRPVLILELEASADLGSITSACRAHPSLTQIEDLLVYTSSFPVDRRHNSKIHREELAQWASTQL